MIVCLDSDCTIYLVEQHPVWGPKLTARLAALRSAGDEIAVSDLVLCRMPRRSARAGRCRGGRRLSSVLR